MSIDIRTIRGAIYVVTPTEDGTVSLPGGTVVASFVGGKQATFMAPANTVTVSDEHAVVDIYMNAATPVALGMGSQAAMQEHLDFASAHLSPAERLCLERYVPHFAEAAAGASEVALAALSDEDAQTASTATMNTNTNASWLAGLLTGWGIKESWAKIIAGALAGALAAAGFLTGCAENVCVPAAAELPPAALAESAR